MWRRVDDPVEITMARLAGLVSDSFETRWGLNPKRWPSNVLAYSQLTGCYYRYIGVTERTQ